MSGRLLRLVCTAAVAAQVLLVPVSATAAPEPPAAADRPVADLLTDLQALYRKAEESTETYNATAEKLKKQRAGTARLNRELARARLSLHSGRSAAGRLARRQYQSSSDLSPYLRLLLARDPQHALDQGHVVGRLAREAAGTVDRLAGSERRAGELARAASKALNAQLALTARQKKERDDVAGKLADVEKLLASLSAGQLDDLAALEQGKADGAQKRFMASGALGGPQLPTGEGDLAVRYAVGQVGKPYVWGATGPAAYDCSGLTSQAWGAAGTPIPRTSQEQWARLRHVPLDELRPGDLVVYFPEATHVALYLGDGKVVQAPRPGAKVKVSPIAANPVLGAVRPDPDGEPLSRYSPPGLPAGAAEGPDGGYATPAGPSGASDDEAGTTPTEVAERRVASVRNAVTQAVPAAPATSAR